MFAAYVAVTLVTAAANGFAAYANFTGHDYARRQAEKLGVPRSWHVPLGSLLAAGALGLLAGFAVPLLGTLAAGGLVLYFTAALLAHLRARDRGLGAWTAFFALAAAAFVLSLAWHGP